MERVTLVIEGCSHDVCATRHVVEDVISSQCRLDTVGSIPADVLSIEIGWSDGFSVVGSRDLEDS